ncbi:hypothetical protein B0A49_01528, partial [Cryomyces minteri]
MDSSSAFVAEGPTPDALMTNSPPVSLSSLNNADEDDGTGINGIGYRPTPAVAYARSQRRKMQVHEWKVREAREARGRRMERRKGHGTDQSQGRGQIISNINACLAVQNTIRSTLGPYGGDLLLVDENGKQTITNDGATVMQLLDIVHPAARILTDIARSQDAEVGDGTTSVVVLAGEILKEIKEHVEQGVSSQTIIK